MVAQSTLLVGGFVAVTIGMILLFLFGYALPIRKRYREFEEALGDVFPTVPQYGRWLQSYHSRGCRNATYQGREVGVRFETDWGWYFVRVHHPLFMSIKRRKRRVDSVSHTRFEQLFDVSLKTRGKEVAEVLPQQFQALMVNLAEEVKKDTFTVHVTDNDFCLFVERHRDSTQTDVSLFKRAVALAIAFDPTPLVDEEVEVADVVEDRQVEEWETTVQW
jgi:hypothetical protein